jgi:uncharacterized OsmC-like protein
MAAQEIAEAMQRVEMVLRRRPDAGRHADAPATAQWQGGTRIVSSHANGSQLLTDMPSELGGSGDQVTPGWLFRAALASCLATCIAMRAAAAGIDLESLVVTAGSHSDSRGVLGIPDAAGDPVCAGPMDVELNAHVRAPGTPPDRLRELVEEGHHCSPVPSVLGYVVPVTLNIDVGVG